MVKKWKLVIVGALVMVGTAAGLAAAQGGGAHDPADRAARKAERKARMLEKFDVNRNGVLDEGEKTAMHQMRMEKRFAMLDTNSDGVISKAEFAAGKHGKFGRHHRGHKRGGTK